MGKAVAWHPEAPADARPDESKPGEQFRFTASSEAHEYIANLMELLGQDDTFKGQYQNQPHLPDELAKPGQAYQDIYSEFVKSQIGKLNEQIAANAESQLVPAPRDVAELQLKRANSSASVVEAPASWSVADLLNVLKVFYKKTVKKA